MTNHSHSSQMTRRQFLRGVGLTMGAGAALAATGGLPALGAGPRSQLAFQTGFTVPPPISGTISGSADFPDGFSVSEGTTLEFDPNVSTTVTVSANVLVAGTLRMRPANAGVVHTLRFEGVNESAYIGGGMVPLDSDVGLWAYGNGVLDLEGTPKAGWNRDGTDPTWTSSDEIRRAPVDPNSWDNFPEFTLGDTPPRYRSDLPAAEVFNLTRNVIIEGTPTGRAHVWVSTNGPQTVRYVKFQHLGPRYVNVHANPENVGVLGRYGFHMHMMGDSARGSLIEGCVATNLGNFAFVPHASHGITIRDCVTYDTTDGAYWWDLGDITDDLTMDHCLAALIRTIPEAEAGNTNQYWQAGFVLGRGTGNRLTDSAAVGVLGNFSASGFIWSRENEEAPNAWAELSNLVSHNNRMNGFTNYQRTDSLHQTQGVIAYNNQQYGFFQGLWNNPQVNVTMLLVNNGGLYQGDQPRGGGIRLRSHSGSATLQTTFEGVTISESPDPDTVAVHLEQHETEFITPTVFRNCTFDHPRKVLVDNIGAYGSKVDFVNCGIEPSDIELFITKPDTHIRVQRADNTAFQVLADGTVETIPPFDRGAVTWTPACPEPPS